MVETNPEIGRVYSKKKMVEKSPLGPDPQFIDSFLGMRSMVEEMYRDFRKHTYRSEEHTSELQSQR